MLVRGSCPGQVGTPAPLPGWGQSFPTPRGLPPGLRGPTIEARSLAGTEGHVLGMRQDPAAGSCVRTLCRSKWIVGTVTLPPPGERPGDLGRQRAAGPCGIETQATSCPRKRQHRPFPPSAPGLPWPFPRLQETTPQSATEATLSSEAWETAGWWARTVEVPEPSQGSACPSGPAWKHQAQMP